jgi:hypothetical protein
MWIARGGKEIRWNNFDDIEPATNTKEENLSTNNPMSLLIMVVCTLRGMYDGDRNVLAMFFVQLRIALPRPAWFPRLSSCTSSACAACTASVYLRQRAPPAPVVSLVSV